MSNTEQVNEDVKIVAEIAKTARQRRKEAIEAYDRALRQIMDADPLCQELHKQSQEEMAKMIQSRHKIINAENELAAMKKQYKEEYKSYKQIKRQWNAKRRGLEELPELAALKKACQEAMNAFVMMKVLFRSDEENSE